MSSFCNGSRSSAAPFSNSHRHSVEVFPLVLGGLVLERPGAVKGAPLFGAAKRTLDGEDRSKRIESEGKDRGNCDGSQSDTNVQNIVVRYSFELTLRGRKILDELEGLLPKME